MSDANSPILDFYPENFEEDMNGKKASWEATIKIPFIDQDRLLKAMGARDHMLTQDEQSRNSLNLHSNLYAYDPTSSTFCPSSLPGSFPSLVKCKCVKEPYELPLLGDGVELITGLVDGVHLGASALAGFPSLKTLPHHAQLSHHGVNVHGHDSRNVSMIITIDNDVDEAKTSDLAASMIGKRTFINWPFLREGMVVALSDEHFVYKKSKKSEDGARGIVATPIETNDFIKYKRQINKIEYQYSKRFGVVTGQVDVLMHVKPLKGLKRMNDGSLVKEYVGEEEEVLQAVQMAVRDVAFEDERYLEQNPPDITEDFPPLTKVFFLGHPYGIAAQVLGTNGNTLDLDLAYFPSEPTETETYTRFVQNRNTERYNPNPIAARGLGISSLAMSKLTSSVLVQMGDGHKVNIGLSLKFDAKGMKVLGYSRKNDRGWEFSQQAYELCARYKEQFPDVITALSGNDHGIARARDMFPQSDNPDARVKEIRSWLKANGVLDLEPVSLFVEQLDKVS